jgi:hypothetical protein
MPEGNVPAYSWGGLPDVDRDRAKSAAWAASKAAHDPVVKSQ